MARGRASLLVIACVQLVSANSQLVTCFFLWLNTAGDCCLVQRVDAHSFCLLLQPNLHAWVTLSQTQQPQLALLSLYSPPP